MIVLLERGGREEGLAGRLADGEEHHLRVRRASHGERVQLRDGAGLVGTGRLVRQREGWQVEVETARRVGRPPPLTLAVGAGDRERFEWLVEKAAELGVTAVTPLETELAAAVATRVRPQHLDKLRRRALEAVKQCGAAWAPEIRAPEPLPAFLARPLEGEGWLADPEGGGADVDAGEPLTVLVGPEGGLTETERAAVRAAGYRPVRLGPNVLRFETAAVAAAALAVAARLSALGGRG
ncbi:MAG: RsmE family RNA methyltransferase [Gemmatimonadales bacterium]